MRRTLILAAALLAPVLAAAPSSASPAVVQLEVDVRDALHGALDRLVAASAASAARQIPDLTVLTTEPVANTESSGFGWRNDPIRHDRGFHRGADFRAKPGTPVLAAGDGVVTFAGRQGGYGNVIYVDHGGGVTTRYAHLRRIETKKGAVLAAGDRIGQVGSTGRATGPHLHFEVRLDDRAVDPVTAMTVAELERTSPSAGQLAAYALTPERQAHVLNKEDQGSARHVKESRPERAGRGPRTKALM